MNISNREKYLLGILVTLIISFGYYKLIYTKQSAKLELKVEERNLLKEKYDNTVNSINSLDDKIKEVENLAKTLVERTSNLYPEIMQEKIILELDSMLKASKLEGNIVFAETEIRSLEKLIADKDGIYNSSVQDLVNEYNGEAVSQENNSKDSSNPEVSTETTEDTETTKATVEEMKVAIKFNGSYENVKSFVSELEKNERIIALTNITIIASSKDILSGTMNIEYHGVPKLTDEDSEYLKWTLKNTYGKEDLFSSGAASGAYAVIASNEDKDVNDFEMILRSIDSEMDSFSMRLSGDDKNTTTISSDEKDEEVEITLSEENGKLYYKYKNSESSYPLGYDYLQEFTSKSKDIIIDILSEKRTIESDTKKVKFKVINKTSKTVKVIVEKDDIESPRVDILTEGNKVNVTKVGE